MRHQYHHCTDVVPTILECCGSTMPDVVDGVEQTPLAGRLDALQLRRRRTRRRAKETQYYEMLGTRAIWHKGWKAVDRARPASINQGTSTTTAGSSSTPTWTAPRRTTSPHAASRRRSRSCPQLWLAEAKKNNVLPLNDYGVRRHSRDWSTSVTPPRTAATPYYPDTSEVPEASAARTLGSSFKILAEVEFTKASAGRDRLAGLAVRRLHDVREGRSAALRLQLHRDPAGKQKLSCPAPYIGKAQWSESTSPRCSVSEKLEVLGTMTLYVDDIDTCRHRVISCRHRKRPLFSARRGRGRRIDSADPVSTEYPRDLDFTGGQIFSVTYDVGDDAHIDLNGDSGRYSHATKPALSRPRRTSLRTPSVDFVSRFRSGGVTGNPRSAKIWRATSRPNPAVSSDLTADHRGRLSPQRLPRQDSRC